jgi:hypothetical protein
LENGRYTRVSCRLQGVVEYTRDRFGNIKGIKRIIFDAVQNQTADNDDLVAHPPKK